MAEFLLSVHRCCFKRFARWRAQLSEYLARLVSDWFGASRDRVERICAETGAGAVRSIPRPVYYGSVDCIFAGHPLPMADGAWIVAITGNHLGVLAHCRIAWVRGR